jgi:hypothetical protein
MIGQHIDIVVWRENRSQSESNFYFILAKCGSNPEATYPGVYEFLKTKETQYVQLLSLQSIDRGSLGAEQKLQPQISGFSPNTEEALDNI